MESQWQVRLVVGKKFGPNWRADTFDSRKEANELYNTLLERTVKENSILMDSSEQSSWKYRIGSTDYYVYRCDDEERSFSVSKVIRGWFFDEAVEVFTLTLTKIVTPRLVSG